MWSLRIAAPVLGTCLLLACSTRKPPAADKVSEHRSTAHSSAASLRASIEQPSLSVSADLPWILFGGGSDPISNQVSLAQDLALLGKLLEGRGLTLFASGPGAQLAVARNATEEASTARAWLARLFSPDAEATDYRPAEMHIDGPSTADHVKETLARALSRGEAPLLVYGACHGSPGEQVQGNSLSLWGGWPLTVRDVASVLDQGEGKRPTRFVITACFGGGFADLIFRGADPEGALREEDVCGLFAAPANDEASGCDPNPNRREQESYALHLLHALSGKDRKEQERTRDIDLDGDGKIALLEAHTWARIESRSFDIPTTTSERFLRHAVKADADAALDPLAAPEDLVVQRALGRELELDSEAAARAKLAELDDIMTQAAAQVDEAQKAADDAFYGLRIALLERYPLLEHPWEARTQKLLRREGPAILGLLTSSELASAHRQSEAELAEALEQHDGVRVARARVLRLVQAYETVRLASWLYKRGGAPKAHYDRLRTCERWVPRLRAQR